MLLFLKIIHTIIWLIVFLSILYILFSGITGRIDNLIWVAISIVVIEGIVLLVNKWKCPLTPLVSRYSDDKKANFDIFLPNWLAKYGKEIGLILFVIGIILVLINHLKVFFN
jgi:hypothetical protein